MLWFYLIINYRWKNLKACIKIIQRRSLKIPPSSKTPKKRSSPWSMGSYASEINTSNKTEKAPNEVWINKLSKWRFLLATNIQDFGGVFIASNSNREIACSMSTLAYRTVMFRKRHLTPNIRATRAVQLSG